MTGEKHHFIRKLLIQKIKVLKDHTSAELPSFSQDHGLQLEKLEFNYTHVGSHMTLVSLFQECDDNDPYPKVLFSHGHTWAPWSQSMNPQKTNYIQATTGFPPHCYRAACCCCLTVSNNIKTSKSSDSLFKHLTITTQSLFRNLLSVLNVQKVTDAMWRDPGDTLPSSYHCTARVDLAHFK